MNDSVSKMDKDKADDEDDNSTDMPGLMDARDVDSSDMETMKGDTIGDTMYSAVWILNVLMSLSKVHEDGWSESLENELCLLWDMTAEKDVALFLHENNFLRIAEVSLNISESPRMTEIIVGILGNMCCQPEVIRSLGENIELVTLLFDLLSSDDAETLIQLLRLLRVAVWNIQVAENGDSLWSENFKKCSIFGQSLVFILKSSTNDDLLIAAINLLQSMVVADLHQEILLQSLSVREDILPALLESYTQIIPKQDGNHTRSELKVINNWLQVLSSVTEMNASIFTLNESDQVLTNILDTLLRILQPYVHAHHLIPLDEQSAIGIHECVKFILRIQQNGLSVGPEIVFIILTIIFHLKSTNRTIEEEFDDDNEKDLSNYLEKYWFYILDIYDVNQLHDVLQMCEEKIVKFIVDMTKSNVQSTSNKIEKLTIANASVNQ